MKNMMVAAGMTWLLIAMACLPVAAPAGGQAMKVEGIPPRCPAPSSGVMG